MQKPLLFILIIVVAFSCKENSTHNSDQREKPAATSEENWVTLSGRTMGTVYNIKFDSQGKVNKSLKRTIDSTLVSINDAVSTYEPQSIISKFNNPETNELALNGSTFFHQHFIINYLSSQLVYSDTNGAFDATVMPLVNYWGFGYTEKKPVEQIDSQKVSRILELVGMDKISDTKDTDDKSINNFIISKSIPGISLDFSAIAKGYAVDVIADFLDDQDIKTFMVEIGGEVKVATDTTSNKVWKIGINEPLKDSPVNSLNAIVNPVNNAMATSGNYRNYHETKELSYGHEINPKTGFPLQTDIFSASVITESCKMADAYATAFMIMGLEKSLSFVNSRPNFEACFITLEDGELVNIYSNGFEEYLVDTKN